MPARPFDAAALLQRALPTVRQRYQARDTMLYALGVGAAMGAKAWDERHLRFVYERQLQALPTQCAMLGDPGFWMREPDTGLDWQRLVHAEESMQPHRQPTAGAGEAAQPALPALPDRPCDHAVHCATDSRAPLIYRLSTDLNPLHVDPALARSVGFDRPIMHGMCTFGLLGLLLVTEFCGFDASRLASLRARFTAPLYPGETLHCEFWREGEQLRFRATTVERGAIVIDQGVAHLREHPETT